jgi:DNA-binding NtrC family response regulator
VGGFSLDLLASDRPAMRRLVQQVRLADGVRAPVLIIGEPGSGKETVARIIHYQGPDRERSFAALDCRRLPPGVVAGILFGGAARCALGAVYLDEPACLPRDVQLRLAEHLAGADAGSVEAARTPRLLAGSGDPEEAVRSGRLLEELYCLLGPLTLQVPPLGERREDLPRLVEHLLGNLNAQSSGRVVGLTAAAWEVVRHHHWPGNLDELRQVLADARARAAGERIDAGDLPAALRLAQRLEQDPLRAAPRPVPLEQTMEQVERRLIQVALRRARGQRALAAELLGIYRGRLLRRMKALGMAEADEDEGSD